MDQSELSLHWEQITLDMLVPSSELSPHRVQQQSKYQYFLRTGKTDIKPFMNVYQNLLEILSTPVVAHGRRNISSCDLFSLFNRLLRSELQLKVTSLDVVCVADTVTVDQAVNGVENNPRVLLQSSLLELHTIYLEYPDTSVNLLL